MKGMKAYIGLGSNVGNGKKTLQDAWITLGGYDTIECLKLSSPYLSAPVDMESENWFTNAVGVLKTTLQPQELLEKLLAVETSFGRRRPENVKGYQDRSLDLDLLYFDGIVMSSEMLTLPHPQIGGRLFVLEPLAELESQVLDQVSGHTPQEMVEKLKASFLDGTAVKQEISRSDWKSAAPGK